MPKEANGTGSAARRANKTPVDFKQNQKPLKVEVKQKEKLDQTLIDEVTRLQEELKTTLETTALTHAELIAENKELKQKLLGLEQVHADEVEALQAEMKASS